MCKMSVTWLIKISSSGRLFNINLTFILFFYQVIHSFNHSSSVLKKTWAHVLKLLHTLALVISDQCHDISVSPPTMTSAMSVASPKGIYIVFLICDCFCSCFFIFVKIWYWNARPKRALVQASPNFICFFYESNTEGTNFRIMFIIMFHVIILCMFCFVFNLCKIWCSEKPWVDGTIWTFNK